MIVLESSLDKAANEAIGVGRNRSTTRTRMQLQMTPKVSVRFRSSHNKVDIVILFIHRNKKIVTTKVFRRWEFNICCLVQIWVLYSVEDLIKFYMVQKS
jgi:hypothetical protein